MNKNTDSFLTGFGAIFVVLLCLVGFLGLMLYSCWASAFVVFHLWGWFVAPVFGIKLLTMAQSFGLALIVGYATYSHSFKTTEDTRTNSSKISELAILFLRPWITLAIGWVCHTYFM